jgi:hypothetical protein
VCAIAAGHALIQIKHRLGGKVPHLGDNMSRAVAENSFDLKPAAR